MLLTLRDASRATGLSIKAIRRRVERGTLPYQLVDGRRRIPMSALLEAGLLVARPEDRPPPPIDPVTTLSRRVDELEARVAELEERSGAAPSLLSLASTADHATSRPV